MWYYVVLYGTRCIRWYYGVLEVWCGIVRHCVVLYGTRWYSNGTGGTAGYDLVLYGTIWYYMAFYGTLRYGTVRSVLDLTQCTMLPIVGYIVLYYLLYLYYI